VVDNSFSLYRRSIVLSVTGCFAVDAASSCATAVSDSIAQSKKDPSRSKREIDLISPSIDRSPTGHTNCVFGIE
jgi:hypothetical protein